MYAASEQRQGGYQLLLCHRAAAVFGRLGALLNSRRAGVA